MAPTKTALSANRFKEYHDYLKEHDSINFTDSINTICQVLGITQASYYRKLSNPDSLSLSDKASIARIYKLPAHFIFPELEGINI